MIIFTKIGKSIDYKDFITQNVHPAKFHCYYNGAMEFYSAILRNNTKKKKVILLHNGTIFSAYEPSTDLMYLLEMEPHIQSLKDLRDGDNVKIIMRIPQSTI